MKALLEAKIKEIRENRYALLAKRDELYRLVNAYQQEMVTIDRQVMQIDGAVEGLTFAIGQLAPDAEPQVVAKRGRPKKHSRSPVSLVEKLNANGEVIEAA